MTSLSTLCIRIKTNQLLCAANDIVLQQSVTQIIQAVGGLKSILFELTKSLNIQQLKSIHNIISKEQRKFKLTQNKLKASNISISNDNMQIDQDNDDNDIDSMDQTESNKSLFLYLPNECLSHICGYLHRCNIKSFKLTCRQIGVSCLEEMQKISISVLNINNPFNNINQNDADNLYHLTNHFKTTRHNKTKRFYSLFEEWELKYNIPEKYQLIFQFNIRTHSLSLIDSQIIRLTSIPSNATKYLMVDKRNIIIWNKYSPRIFNESSHNLSTSNYQMMILEYFNVFDQTAHITPIILYKLTDKPTHSSLIQYIEKNFILIDGYGINNSWYNIFKSKLIKNKTQNKIRIYGHEYNESQMFNPHTMNMLGDLSDLSQYYKFTFQLNENQFVYPTAQIFCTTVRRILRLACKNNITDLKSCIKNYNKTITNKKHKLSLNFKTENQIIQNINFSIYSFIPKVKKLISERMYNGIIHSKYIQITNAKNNSFVGLDIIKYKIHLYDSEIINKNKYCHEYILRIFCPLNCPYPYYINDNKPILFSIKYKKEFIIKDFLQYIFDTIKNGKNNILYHQFESLIPLLNDINERNCILCPVTQFSSQSKIEYITPYNFNEEYINYQNGHSTRKFDLFLYNHKTITNNNENKIHLQIKFISNASIGDPFIPPIPSSYTPQQYISQHELSKLQINDQIYHRDFEGLWYKAQIIAKNNTKMKIHYIAFSSKYDVWCDIETDFHRFAGCNAHPYSTHSAVSNEYKKGDNVFINPSCKYGNNFWFRASIIDIGRSRPGEVYFTNPKYYTHIDNANEIRKYKPLNCKMYSKYHRYEMVKHKNNPNGMMVNKIFKKFIGLPLNIFIDKNDTLENIINKYLSDTKEFVMTTYRVKYENTNNKLISISKNKRNLYKPYNEFIKKYPNDFILIKLKKCNKKNFNIVMFPNTIIGGKELICSNEKEMKKIIKLIFDESCEHNLSNEIATRLIEIYEEESFSWNDIVNDFNDGFNNDDCFAVNYVSDTLADYNVDVSEDYVWSLLQRCKPIKKSSNTN